MCAKYSLPSFDWLKLSHHLVSGESTLHEVTLFEARSRIFLCLQPSLARLYSAAASKTLGWLVGSNDLLCIHPAIQIRVFKNSSFQKKKKSVEEKYTSKYNYLH